MAQGSAIRTTAWDSQLARLIALPLRHTRVHPNHVTTVGMVVGLAAAALYAEGSTRAASWAAGLYVLSAVLDHVDGELARMTGKTSAAGHTYDRIADLTVRLCLFAGMGIGLRRGALGNTAVVLGVAAGIAFVAIFVLRGAMALRRGWGAIAPPSFGGFDLEDILYVIAPVTWLGWLAPFLVGAGVGAPLFSLWVARNYWRLRRTEAERRVRPPRRLESFAYPGLVTGLAVFTALFAYQGIHEVGAALAVAGSGLLVVTLFHLVPMVLDALGWRALLARDARPGVGTIVVARWIGESVNALLPVMQLGGAVARVRVLTRRGVPEATAGATVAVDVTLVAVTQLLFAAGGVWLLVERLGVARLTELALAGCAIMASLLAAFVLAQRRGLFGALTGFVGGIAGGGRLAALSARAAAIDASVTDTYRERRAVIASATWHLVSWLVGAGEVWLALYFLGSPVDLRTAMLLESLGQAVRAGAFAIPGALGVQEGGFVLLGHVLGLSPGTCLALSLSKRVRELCLGIPGLVAWQLMERRPRPAEADGVVGVELPSAKSRS